MSKVFDHYNGTVEVMVSRMVEQTLTIDVNLTYGDTYEDAIEKIRDVVGTRLFNGSVDHLWENNPPERISWQAYAENELGRGEVFREEVKT